MKALDIGSLQLNWSATGANIEENAVDSWCALTGQHRDAAQNWGWVDMLHPDDQVWVRQRWQQALATRRLYETVYRVRDRYGSYQEFRLKCTPLFTESGDVKSWLCWLVCAADDSTPQEHDLWHGQALYKLMFEQASIGIICLSLDGYFLQVNQYFCHMLGYPQEEIVDHPVWEFTAPEDMEKGYTSIESKLLGNTFPYSLEKRYIAKKGDAVWVKITTTLLKTQLGEPKYFLSLIEDITKHKQAEEERAQLLAREQKAKEEATELASQLQTIFSAMTESVLVYDAKGNLLQLNPAAERLLQVNPHSDFMQKSYEDRIAFYQIRDWQGNIIPIEETPSKRILRGETLVGEDIMLYVPPGRDVYLSVSGSPIYDQQKQIIGGVSVWRDVSEQRQKERRVLQTLHILLQLVEELAHIPERADSFSPEEIIAVSSMASIGQRLVELVSQALECEHVAFLSIEEPSYRLNLVNISGLSSAREQQYRELVSGTLLSDYFEEATITHLQAGEVLVRDLRQQPFKLPSTYASASHIMIAPMIIARRLVGIFVIDKSPLERVYSSENIAMVKAVAKLTTLVIERVRLLKEWSEARADELALREVNKRFDAFLSIASHELRTPLTAIKGNVQLVLRRLDKLKLLDGGDREELMKEIGRIEGPLAYAVHRASVQDRMISDLLDVSRIRANKLILMPEHADLVKIVQNAVEDVAHLAPDRRIVLHLPQEPTVPVRVDVDRIGQVVNNYLSNAIKYSPQDRLVEVTLSVKNGMAQLSVRDEGPGLSPEVQAHVWGRFYRVKDIEVQYGAGAGLGLGLYICRTIIELHDGQIGVSSTRGEGSTFWFTLPLDSPPASA